MDLSIETQLVIIWVISKIFLQPWRGKETAKSYLGLYLIYIVLVPSEEIIFNYNLKNFFAFTGISQYVNCVLFGLIHIFNKSLGLTWYESGVQVVMCMFVRYVLLKVDNLWYAIFLHLIYNISSTLLVQLMLRNKPIATIEHNVPKRRWSMSDKTKTSNEYVKKKIALPKDLDSSFDRYDQSKRTGIFSGMFKIKKE